MKTKNFLLIFIFLILSFNANAQAPWYREGKITDSSGALVTPPGDVNPLPASPLNWQIPNNAVPGIYNFNVRICNALGCGP